MTDQEQITDLILLNSILRACLRYHGGLIVVGKRADAKDWLYLDEFEGFNRFDDDTKMQNPKVYRTFVGVLKKVLKVEKLYNVVEPSDKFMVDTMLWVHPDMHCNALSKYKLMTGIRYLGSPRQ